MPEKNCTPPKHSASGLRMAGGSSSSPRPSHLQRVVWLENIQGLIWIRCSTVVTDSHRWTAVGRALILSRGTHLREYSKPSMWRGILRCNHQHSSTELIQAIDKTLLLTTAYRPCSRELSLPHLWEPLSLEDKLRATKCDQALLRWVRSTEAAKAQATGLLKHNQEHWKKLL